VAGAGRPGRRSRSPGPDRAGNRQPGPPPRRMRSRRPRRRMADHRDHARRRGPRRHPDPPPPDPPPGPPPSARRPARTQRESRPGRRDRPGQPRHADDPGRSRRRPPSLRWPAAGPGPPGKILDLAVRAASRAAARARAAAAADAAAGGCAHAAASPGYRPPPRLHDYITARDLTCRFPVCRQPARHADLDHTIPFDDGGLTCRCNLGSLCRTHHIIKHHPGWKLHQHTPGTFTWTTPSGRTFTTTPDTHIV